MNLDFNLNNYIQYSEVCKSLNSIKSEYDQIKSNFDSFDIDRELEITNLKSESKEKYFKVLSLLNGRGGVFKVIHNLFLSFSKKYKKEFDTQNAINALSKSENPHRAKLTAAAKAVENFRRSNHNILSKFSENQTDNAFNLMVSLCGGKEKFEALPVLDLKGQIGLTGYIDYIKPSDMTAPIMRFTDDQGKRGIAVRAKSLEDGQERIGVQTFFERYQDDGTWVEAGAPFVVLPNSGYFIDRGLVKVESIAALQKFLSGLIENQSVDVERPSGFGTKKVVHIELV